MTLQILPPDYIQILIITFDINHMSLIFPITIVGTSYSFLSCSLCFKSGQLYMILLWFWFYSLPLYPFDTKNYSNYLKMKWCHSIFPHMFDEFDCHAKIKWTTQLCFICTMIDLRCANQAGVAIHYVMDIHDIGFV